MRQFFPLLLAAIFFLAGCAGDAGEAPSDREYLPLQVGSYWIYNVEETVYTITDDPLVLDYELKVAVVDSFLNNDNAYTYVIYRYKRENVTDPWDYLDTWSARYDKARIVVTEENVDYIKMIVPLGEGLTWDGNGFNSMDDDEYECNDYRKPVTVEGTEYSDCVEIVQHNLDDTIVMMDIRSEVYSRGVGMIYREIRQLNFCTVGCTSPGQIENGVEYFQSIKEYGFE